MTTEKISIQTLNAPLSAGTGSTRVAMPTGTVGAPNVVVVNDGPNTAFITTGDVTVVATTTNYPIQSGTTQTFSKPPENTHFAAICATGTATLYVIPTAGE